MGSLSDIIRQGAFLRAKMSPSGADLRGKIFYIVIYIKAYYDKAQNGELPLTNMHKMLYNLINYTMR